jgi:ATP-dependent DNA helicase RecG
MEDRSSRNTFMTIAHPQLDKNNSLYPSTDISVRRSLRALRTPIRFLKGVGPKRAAQLEGLGLRTVEDLLYHLPFRYEDRRQIKKIRDATLGAEETFVGRLVTLERKYIPRRRTQILLGRLADSTGSIGLVWYRAPSYLSSSLAKGQKLLVHGKVETGIAAQKRIVHPEFTIVDAEDEQQLRRILPVYVRPGGLSLSLMRSWVAQGLADYGRYLSSRLPASVLQRQGLVNLWNAMIQVHEPAQDADCSSLNAFSSVAHRSIIFDELFYLQLGLILRKRFWTESVGVSLNERRKDLTSSMRSLLPFKLTAAQERVINEIYEDMESSQPMQRLIQGDVGSGKTMVAWLASLRLIEHGFQALWMAPTELLAEQHFRNLQRFCAALKVRSALLTASLPPKQKKSLLELIERGDIDLIVGTHAVIQDRVRVPRMGLGVIDEQHRFGVIQRMALQRRAEGQPHILLMSATPIPRSLAMILYGDMEVSFLDEMPPGRIPVRTRLFQDRQRHDLYRLVLEQLRGGHQAFIVYPLVEPSDQLQQLRDATRMADELSRGVFKDFKVGMVHGRMAAAERDRIMRLFRAGDLQVLVATTVIEVGIDIPDATVMVIEHAERFGLSQLHQLRGRVGRGKSSGYCFLVSHGTQSRDAVHRLRVLEQEHDGFRIAEADLALRGPGEFLGTRQSGLADFRLVNLARDSQLLFEARKEALEWLRKDPTLKSRESSGIREILKHRWGRRLELGAIG